jgi:hypothetical protein
MSWTKQANHTKSERRKTLTQAKDSLVFVQRAALNQVFGTSLKTLKTRTASFVFD